MVDARHMCCSEGALTLPQHVINICTSSCLKLGRNSSIRKHCFTLCHYDAWLFISTFKTGLLSLSILSGLYRCFRDFKMLGPQLLESSLGCHVPFGPEWGTVCSTWCVSLPSSVRHVYLTSPMCTHRRDICAPSLNFVCWLFSLWKRGRVGICIVLTKVQNTYS